jgi:hypothetical protein
VPCSATSATVGATTQHHNHGPHHGGGHPGWYNGHKFEPYSFSNGYCCCHGGKWSAGDCI